VFRSKNALLYRYEKHRMVIQNQDQFFEDFIACVPIFEPFQILQTKIQTRLWLDIISPVFMLLPATSWQNEWKLYDW